MLIGEYHHSIDSKNRVSLPAKFRTTMGETVVINRGIDNCLSVYTQEAWKEMLGKLSILSTTKRNEREFKRRTLSGAAEVSVDSQGRILLPDNLKEYAGLEKKVVWAGVGNLAEIWAEDTWGKHLSDSHANPEELAESLEGII
ncbi:MAG: division/cell wall cluster transcriptional repressor MraZ [Patescibacteria group bacterium]